MDPKKDLFSGFHRLSRSERLRRLKDSCHLTDSDLQILTGETPFPLDIGETFIENVIGVFPLPLGIATHFEIDGKPVLVPMAVEETSVVAAASSTAKWVCKEGNIQTYTKGRLVIGQIQIPRVQNPELAKDILRNQRNKLIDLANSYVPGLVARGGGIRDFAIRDVCREDAAGDMLVIHVYCDPCDAMGANLINQVCEGLKPAIEKLTGEKVGLCILSNLVDSHLTVAEVVVRNIDPKVGAGVEEASQFALSDPYRASTHNKGVLNGIDPILIATGNDWRAVEAGIHAFAARTGKYQPITQWKMRGNDLHGQFEAPIAVGTVGGVTRLHPTAKIALKILGIQRAEELSRIAAAVGLVQNLGALKALSTVGIVKGHMQLHAANLALAAGAEIHEIAEVRKKLAQVLSTEKHINVTHAIQILKSIRGGESSIKSGNSPVPSVS